ncbi:FK506-binding protein 2B [Cokeromyces recurvatus]|uniref:FK506-binding protein 2B n=1 Tax=Cokeromyces recurvatus TaxID=90255 RepID=UPI002220F08E|nr:FK506-binding protein 2B [Cokeromyces recurvatus]KAI7898553.1 FK506-binding protein 2B [Cokeromyces recurvatus]
MRIIINTIFFLFQFFLISTLALKEPPTHLQVGIKKRIPAEECTIKSTNGDQLTMHYTGTLFDTGVKFDSSLDRNQPFVFKLGQGQVIQGWDQGLVGMCIGEKRKLVIPPHMGYGDRGAGGVIPGGATLVFEVELLDIKRGSNHHQKDEFKPISSDKDQLVTFTSPSFIFSTAIILVLFFFVFRLARKQDIADAKKEQKSQQ